MAHATEKTETLDTFPLMRLPPEIRLRIYELYYADKRLSLQTHHHASHVPATKKTLKWKPEQVTTQRKKRSSYSLLLVSRQIRLEATPILLKTAQVESNAHDPMFANIGSSYRAYAEQCEKWLAQILQYCNLEIKVGWHKSQDFGSCALTGLSRLLPRLQARLDNDSGHLPPLRVHVMVTGSCCYGALRGHLDGPVMRILLSPCCLLKDARYLVQDWSGLEAMEAGQEELESTLRHIYSGRGIPFPF